MASQEQEAHSLRTKCQHLEKEARDLVAVKKRLENKLLALQKQLCLEEVLVKHLKERRATELRTLRKDYIEKFETAMNLLKVRVRVEMSQSLRQHKEQLKLNFRSDLLKLTRKNCQLTNLLRYIQQLQQLEKDSESKHRVLCCTRRQVQEGQLHQQVTSSAVDCYHSSGGATPDPHFQALRIKFQQQIAKLLDELQEREEGIDSLHKNVQQAIPSQQIRRKTIIVSSPSSPSPFSPSSYVSSVQRTTTRCTLGSKNNSSQQNNATLKLSCSYDRKQQVGRQGTSSSTLHQNLNRVPIITVTTTSVANSNKVCATTTTAATATAVPPPPSSSSSGSALLVRSRQTAINPICSAHSTDNNSSVGPVRNKVYGEEWSVDSQPFSADDDDQEKKLL